LNETWEKPKKMGKNEKITISLRVFYLKNVFLRNLFFKEEFEKRKTENSKKQV
jgi:hypothetical protein